MIQPKSEYLDSEENIEDLTLDDDNGMDNSGMDAGPSQRQGGYQWHMGDQGADEVFMAAQEAVGANRDAQDDEVAVDEALLYSSEETIVISTLSSQNLRGPRPPKTYRCDRCDRAYYHSQSLVRHRTVECGKAPRVKCPHCPYRCKQKTDMKKHIHRKHGDLPDVPIDSHGDSCS